MIRLPPSSTRTDTLFPYTTLFRSTVAWLVKYHLLMSATAFKRDLLDPKTIQDFVAIVQSADRLRLLLVLTVVDIRAVGPGTWSERSEERRVGKECVRTCRSRWSPYH